MEIQSTFESLFCDRKIFKSIFLISCQSKTVGLMLVNILSYFTVNILHMALPVISGRRPDWLGKPPYWGHKCLPLVTAH